MNTNDSFHLPAKFIKEFYILNYFLNLLKTGFRVFIYIPASTYFIINSKKIIMPSSKPVAAKKKSGTASKAAPKKAATAKKPIKLGGVPNQGK